MDVLVLVGSFAIVCLLGMPVAYALGLAAILAALWSTIPLEAVMLKVSGGMSGFSLLAIPFFILAGAIMAVGGMAERLVNLAKVFVGFIRGGMALVNIIASTMFGCISGSSVADTAAVGSVKIAVDAIWGLITIVIILGGILSGVFTPTESAAVACVYAFFVTMFIYRDCKWSELPKLIGRVVRTVGIVMIMIGFSIAFGYMMALMQIPAKTTEFFVAIW